MHLKEAIFNAVDKAIKHATCETNYVVKFHCLHEKHTIYVSDSRTGMNERGSNAVREFVRQVKANYATSVDGVGLNFADIFIVLPGGKMNIGSHRRVGTTLVMITVINGPMQVAFFKVNGLKAEKTKTHYLTKRGLTRPQPISERRDATMTTSMFYSRSLT
jgi:light-regulated signal transduction histidine kinase (bacteriophytochrome)